MPEDVKSKKALRKDILRQEIEEDLEELNEWDESGLVDSVRMKLKEFVELCEE